MWRGKQRSERAVIAQRRPIVSHDKHDTGQNFGGALLELIFGNLTLQRR